MPEDSIVVPDFYPRLNLIPGRELNMFTARLWDVVELREEVEQADWDDSWQALDQLYHRHNCEPHPENFSEVITAEELATKDQEPIDSGLDDYLPTIRMYSSFYGFGSGKDGFDYSVWIFQEHIQPLFRFLLDECRRSGSVRVPAHWTPSTTSSTINNGMWLVEFRDQLACYKSLKTDRYFDMMDFASTLFTNETGPWLLEGNGPNWSQEEACEQASFYTWDTAMSYLAQEKYAEAIDCLRILSLVGSHHYRFLRAASELVGTPEPCVRDVILEEILRHARGAFPEPALPSELMTQLTQIGLHEKVFSIIEKIIYLLRLQGGQESFDALAQIAQSAEESFARDAATRALAWVPRYPQRDERLSKMIRSRHRRTAKAAQKVIAEIKYHGLFSREGEFASDIEHELHNTMKQFFSSRGEDEEVAKQLDTTFKVGFLKVKVTGRLGYPDCRAAVITADGVPLHTEDVYTREYCGLLDQLPSVDIPEAHLSEDELKQEFILRRAIGNTALLLQGELRQKVGGILSILEIDDMISVGYVIKHYLESEKIELPQANEVTNLANENQIDAYQRIRNVLLETSTFTE